MDSRLWLRRQNEAKQLRDKIDGETLLTREESQAIRRKALEANLKNEETIKSLLALTKEQQHMLNSRQ